MQQTIKVRRVEGHTCCSVELGGLAVSSSCTNWSPALLVKCKMLGFTRLDPIGTDGTV